MVGLIPYFGDTCKIIISLDNTKIMAVLFCIQSILSCIKTHLYFSEKLIRYDVTHHFNHPMNGMSKVRNEFFYLHNYFNLHICPSFRRRPSSRHTFRFPIPAVDSQNVSNKSCLACAQSKKYSFGFTLRPLGS